MGVSAAVAVVATASSVLSYTEAKKVRDQSNKQMKDQSRTAHLQQKEAKNRIANENALEANRVKRAQVQSTSNNMTPRTGFPSTSLGVVRAPAKTAKTVLGG